MEESLNVQVRFLSFPGSTAVLRIDQLGYKIFRFWTNTLECTIRSLASVNWNTMRTTVLLPAGLVCHFSAVKFHKVCTS